MIELAFSYKTPLDVSIFLIEMTSSLYLSRNVQIRRYMVAICVVKLTSLLSKAVSKA